MRILISALSFKNFTGSEMSTLELAKELVKTGNVVHIYSPNVGQPMLDLATKAGIYVTNAMPAYKYDILHLQHKPVAEQVLQAHPNTPAVMHVRSEVIPIYEVPVIHPNVMKYIAVRDSIAAYISSYGILNEDIAVIDNPFDTDRFNTNYEFSGNTRERILFVGTMDYLRKDMLFDIARLCKNTHRDLWLVGQEGVYLKDLKKVCMLTHFGVRQDVESFYKIVDYTVGIFKGRTTIEGWLCDVPAWIYTVDLRGKVKTKKLLRPPEDMDKYSATHSALKVMELYKSIKVKNSEA